MQEDDTFITLQCDKSIGCEFKFLPMGLVLPGLTMFSCPNSHKNTITLPDFQKTGDYKRHDVIIVESDAVQHRTRILVSDNCIQTVPIIREGIGYVTTTEEKKVNDERAEMINKKIEESLSKIIQTTKKEPIKTLDDYAIFKNQIALLKSTFEKLIDVNKTLAKDLIVKEFEIGAVNGKSVDDSVDID